MANDQSIPLAPKSSQTTDQQFPTEFIDIPSEGYFYPASSPLSSGRIELKYMTAKEEDILTSQNLIKKGIVLDELLKALIVNKGIDYGDILTVDKNAIFIAARRLAYGDEYKVKITCPKCEHQSDVSVNLAGLETKPFDFSVHTKGENRFAYTLPITKKTVVYKLLSHKDEQDIDAELKALAKILKTGNSPELTTRLKYMIVSVDGNEDRSAVKKLVDNLPARDSMAFRKHVRENSPDLDISFDYTCEECGYTERMAVPMSADFFWPSA